MSSDHYKTYYYDHSGILTYLKSILEPNSIFGQRSTIVEKYEQQKTMDGESTIFRVQNSNITNMPSEKKLNVNNLSEEDKSTPPNSPFVLCILT